jgi:alpha-L-arabinofuranosidase
MVTIDYGSGSPQEGAAFLAYLNAPVGTSTKIGYGLTWSDATNKWVYQNWQTAGYWAGLRAAMPLAHDDGLNFLRINRATPFGIHYFEVGNEEYGSWETDHHGPGTNTGQPHDPATYVKFARQFAGYARTIDSTIAIGLDTGSIGYDNNWTANVLAQCASQKYIPGFLSDHSYMQAPGSESDSFLLFNTVSDPNNQDPNNPLDWGLRAAGYRQLLQQKLGKYASNVQLLATEFNSVYSNPGKQTTSLVNGLFVADSIGSLLETEYSAGIVWDLRNGFDSSNNNSASLYGWCQGGDYGLLGSNNVPPTTGIYVPYPTYFAEQLLSKMVHNGDTVVQAASDDMNLSVYVVKQATGHLELLVINKNATNDLTGNVQLTGFQPASQAQVWQYGKV